ncbi:MAG: FMN-binding protein [Bacteroidales bacterium]|nr:FMN-binding protein [Bacteroidales bacterium]
MKHFSNKYMLFYALGLAAVVALVLTLVATSLKPRQDKNREVETKQMILKTIGIEATRNNAENLYAENIKETTTANGLPLYKFKLGIIIPLNGNGLWGPIWGYMAIDDGGSVVGAVFDHQGETPGLGAEIATDKFAMRFIGKEMTERPIVLKKNADKDNPYEVDAISGGTMTSNGVTEMLAKAFELYCDEIPKVEDCEAISKLLMEEEQ